MKISQVARLSGVSVRTLHHYDKIGLLIPNKNEQGYRIYSQDDIDKLQIILFYRTLEMPLKEIQKIMNEHHSHIGHLRAQRKKLLDKQKHTGHLIELIDKTIESKERGILMTAKEKLNGINFKDNQYEQEAREKFGDEAVDTSQQKLDRLNQHEIEQLGQEWMDIFIAFNQLKNYPVEDEKVLEQTDKFFHFLNKNFGNYTYDAFYGLGDMYIFDDRFTQNINQYGDNLAQFISEAMKYYATIHS
ncbi:MerR family transcriptional regulator [Macrococcus capreoli]